MLTSMSSTLEYLTKCYNNTVKEGHCGVRAGVGVVWFLEVRVAKEPNEGTSKREGGGRDEGGEVKHNL
jgi:hypothetical protein